MAAYQLHHHHCLLLVEEALPQAHTVGAEDARTDSMDEATLATEEEEGEGLTIGPAPYHLGNGEGVRLHQNGNLMVEAEAMVVTGEVEDEAGGKPKSYGLTFSGVLAWYCLRLDDANQIDT